jgi:hypothetical protein
VPASPTWLRRVPNAIEQLEAWAHDSLTRADLQTLLGVEKARAVQLMHAWGATRRGGRRDLLLAKGAVLRCLKALRRGGRVEQEEQRVERLIGLLQEARVARVRVKVDRAMVSAKLAGLPAGVVVEPRRIVVEFASAKEAVARLFAVAQALGNDWDHFEALVDSDGPEGDTAAHGDSDPFDHRA